MLKELNIQHKLVALLMVKGESLDDIARETGFSVHTLHKYNTDPLFKKHLNNLSDKRDLVSIRAHTEAEKKVDEALIDAINVELELMRDVGASKNLRLKAAEAIVKLTGMAPPSKLDISGSQQTHLTMTDTSYEDEEGDEEIDID